MDNLYNHTIPLISRQLMDLIDDKQDDLIFLSVGAPYHKPDKTILEKAQIALNGESIGYTPSQGLLRLRELVAIKLKMENGIIADPVDNITICNGGSQAIDLAVRALINKGDEVIITDPGYFNYIYCVKFSGGKVVRLPLRWENDFMIDVHELEKLITPRTKLIILNSPNNPTGAALDYDTFLKIAAILEDKNINVISDEVYEYYLYDKNRHYSIGSIPTISPKIITINSISKSFSLCGLRLGYVIAEKGITAKIRHILEYTSISPNLLSQRIAEIVITKLANREHLPLKAYNEKRDLLIDGLSNIGNFQCKKPMGAFYAFVNIKDFGLDSLTLWKLLLNKAKVVTVPGIVYGPDSDNFLRISFASANIKEALSRIANVVNKL